MAERDVTVSFTCSSDGAACLIALYEFLSCPDHWSSTLRDNFSSILCDLLAGLPHWVTEQQQVHGEDREIESWAIPYLSVVLRQYESSSEQRQIGGLLRLLRGKEVW